MIIGKIFYFISASLLLLISLVITFKGENKNEKSRLFLLGYFWLAFLTMFSSIVNLYHYGAFFPFLIRMGMLIAGFILPFSYFYTLQILKPRRFRRSDLLHLIIPVFFAIDYLPFYLLPAAQKVEIIKNLSPTELMIGFSEGTWMPTYGHFAIRMVQVVIYCIAQSLLILQAAKDKSHPVYNDSKSIFSWLKILVGAQFFYFLGPLISGIFWDVYMAGLFMQFCFFGFTALQAVYLFFHPEILYDISSYFKPEPETPMINPIEETEKISGDELDATPDTNRGIEFNEELKAELENKLITLFKEEKPFTQTNYRLKDLSSDMDTPAYLLSAFLNQVYGKNFNEFVNDCRVEYLVELVKNNPSLKQYTIEAMGKMVGFNSRSVLVNAFKRKTGQTPSEFLNRL